MLILLSQDILEQLDELSREPAFVRAMSNLALGVREGKHCVAGPVPLLKTLSEHAALPEDARGTFSLLRQKHHEAGSLQTSMTHLVVVEGRINPEIQRQTVDGQIRFYVPYAYFEDSSRIQKTVLVAENQLDACLYKNFAEAYLYRSNAKGLQTGFRLSGGGGSQLGTTFEEAAKEGFALGVADSDRKWPGAPLGETARGLEAADKSLERKSVCGAYILACRELENLLPPRLLVDSLGHAEATLAGKAAHAEKLCFLGSEEPGRYLDLKSGLRAFDVYCLPANGDACSHLEDVIARTRNKVKKPEGGWCSRQHVRCQKRHDCTCVLFEGLGENILKHVQEFLAENSSQIIGEYLLASKTPGCHFREALGKHLFSWGCGYKKFRV